MSLAQPATAQTSKPEPDYAPDEAMLLLVEMQMRDLMNLRKLGMELAEDIAVRGQGKNDAQTGIAFKGIGKLILQICALEQHTLRLRATEQVALKNARTRAKKEQVKRKVAAVLDAADLKVPAPESVRLRRENLLKGIFLNYDFSDPRTVAAMVAEICEKVGMKFQPEVWPGARPPAAEAPEPAEPREAANAAQPPEPVKTAEPPEPVKTGEPAVKPASPLPSRPFLERSAVSSIGLMAPPRGETEAPPVLLRAQAKGRGPP